MCGIIEGEVKLGGESQMEDFGNHILYEMCSKGVYEIDGEEYDKSKHDNEIIVAGKLWLIGRSYAVSPQRQQNEKSSKNEKLPENARREEHNKQLTKIKKNDENDESEELYQFFFYEIAEYFVENAKKIKHENMILDDFITELSDKKYTGDFEKDKEILLKTIEIIGLFNRIMIKTMAQYNRFFEDKYKEDEKNNFAPMLKRLNNHVSLASKYLHFHLRDIVFIYDSYTQKSKKHVINKYTERFCDFGGNLVSFNDSSTKTFVEKFGLSEEDDNNEVKKNIYFGAGKYRIKPEVRNVYIRHAFRCYAVWCELKTASPRKIDLYLLEGVDITNQEDDS